MSITCLVFAFLLVIFYQNKNNSQDVEIQFAIFYGVWVRNVAVNPENERLVGLTSICSI